MTLELQQIDLVRLTTVYRIIRSYSFPSPGTAAIAAVPLDPFLLINQSLTHLGVDPAIEAETTARSAMPPKLGFRWEQSSELLDPCTSMDKMTKGKNKSLEDEKIKRDKITKRKNKALEDEKDRRDKMTAKKDKSLFPLSSYTFVQQTTKGVICSPFP